MDRAIIDCPPHFETICATPTALDIAQAEIVAAVFRRYLRGALPRAVPSLHDRKRSKGLFAAFEFMSAITIERPLTCH